MTEKMRAILARREATRLAERLARWQREIDEIESRNGELPKRDLTELANEKQALQTALAELLEDDETRPSVIASIAELELQERIATDTTTSDDAPEIERRKEAQAAKAAGMRAWLAGNQ